MYNSSMSVLPWVPLVALLAAPPPESRALAFLAREVPRWSVENKCYSCHNNGDAARALYTAVRLSYPVPAKALADTSRWLAKPQQWDHNGGEGPFNDKQLTTIQFAAALVDAVEAGLVKDRSALTQAAARVVAYQRNDGSWLIDVGESLGSPATYGTCLATYQACRVLRTAEPRYYQAALAKADRWFRTVMVESVLDAAAILLALEGKDDAAVQQRQRCLALIRKGQPESGGWGPYAHSPPEAFDTALVLLALSRSADQPGIKEMLRKGRAFLVKLQKEDGSWEETTRPPGNDSYAQRLSTSGWATLALLHTANNR